MKAGMDEVRLLVGACICDVLVQARPEDVVAAFGAPVKLAEDGRAIADPSLESKILFLAAAWPNSSWSVTEAVNHDPEPADYIVTLLRQAGAALEGNVLPLPLSYSNGLGVTQRVSRELGVPAVAVWGSDEWKASVP